MPFSNKQPGLIQSNARLTRPMARDQVGVTQDTIKEMMDAILTLLAVWDQECGWTQSSAISAVKGKVLQADE